MGFEPSGKEGPDIIGPMGFEPSGKEGPVRFKFNVYI